MALLPITLPIVADVPVGLAGVPYVRTAVSTAVRVASAINPTLGSELGDLLGANEFAWGVYDEDGALVLQPDSVYAFDYRRAFRVPAYAIEEGGFGSYNKVATPFEPRLTLTKGGSLDSRRLFLATLESLVEDTELYTIVSPEASYVNVNFIDIALSRSARSAELLVVEVTLAEIRVVEAGQFTTTPKDDSAQPAVDGGSVAPTQPTAAQTSAATKAIGSKSGTSPAVRADADALMAGVTYRQANPVTLTLGSGQ